MVIFAVAVPATAWIEIDQKQEGLWKEIVAVPATAWIEINLYLLALK